MTKIYLDPGSFGILYLHVLGIRIAFVNKLDDDVL
jgi:hypothetical protein